MVKARIVSVRLLVLRVAVCACGAFKCNMFSVAGLRSSHSVLRGVPTGVSDRPAALPAGSADPQSTKALLLFLLFLLQPSRHSHRRPTLGLHQQVHLSALPLAVLRRLPQVPDVPLPVLHLRAARPAHREVSPLSLPLSLSLALLSSHRFSFRCSSFCS